MSSRLMGVNVYNNQNVSVGEIEDPPGIETAVGNGCVGGMAGTTGQDNGHGHCRIIGSPSRVSVLNVRALKMSTWPAGEELDRK